MNKDAFRNLRDLEKSQGVDTGNAEGTYNVRFDKRVEVQVNDAGKPRIFMQGTITSGDHEGRSYIESLTTFVSEERDGEPKTDTEINRGNGFVRGKTNKFLKAAWGSNFERDWPDALYYDKDSDVETVTTALKSWLPYLKDVVVEATVKDSEDSDFQDINYKRALDQGGFQL